MKHATPPVWSKPAHPKGHAVSSFKVTKRCAPVTAGAPKLLTRFGDALVCVQIGYGEMVLLVQVKAAGASGTQRLACGSCRSPWLESWVLQTEYARFRNEIDVESISIQKSCIFPDVNGYNFKIYGLDQN